VGLQVYRRKRKFDVTPEPRGRAHRAKGNQFVIQKHAARRLHYDLRLELDGVMKSWAVTRGPSLVPDEKRLAIHVEDHPIEYNAFEGTIPQGEYGGGTVMVWDRGRWYPEGDPHAGYKKGHLAFTLDGEKLHGRWHLVRMHASPGGRLLFIASHGQGPVNDVVISGNQLHHHTMSTDVMAPNGERRKNWIFRNNTSDTVSYNRPIRFISVDGVLVSGNKQPISGPAEGVTLMYVCGGKVVNNTFGKGKQVKRIGPTCSATLVEPTEPEIPGRA